jgi:hypothetical protein
MPSVHQVQKRRPCHDGTTTTVSSVPHRRQSHDVAGRRRKKRIVIASVPFILTGLQWKLPCMCRSAPIVKMKMPDCLNCQKYEARTAEWQLQSYSWQLSPINQLIDEPSSHCPKCFISATSAPTTLLIPRRCSGPN